VDARRKPFKPDSGRANAVSARISRNSRTQAFARKFVGPMVFRVNPSVEVGGCDPVALKGDDPPVVVIGELKLIFNLSSSCKGPTVQRYAI
jgi:hypothetical protein